MIALLISAITLLLELCVCLTSSSSTKEISWTKASNQKIYSTSLEDDGYFGWSVSSYGNYILVGSFGGADATQIWVKESKQDNQPAMWYRDVVLSAGETLLDNLFGYSVSLFEDYALVGCPMLYAAGHAYIYNHNWRTGAWSQMAKLSGNDDYYSIDFFGGSVSIHDNIAAISAWKANTVGAVYIYYRSFYGSWSMTQRIVAEDSVPFDYFGRSVSLGSGIVMVGAHGDDDAGFNSGSAYVFITSDGSNWSQEAKLLADDAYVADNFGESVGLYDNVAVIGAKYSESNRDLALETGSAYVFIRQPPDEFGQVIWMQEARLQIESPTPYAAFGASVSIARDTIIVGALGEGSNRTGTGPAAVSGCAYVFQRTGRALLWSQQAQLVPTGGRSGDFFGKAVALDHKAQVAVVGAYGEDRYCASCGAVYVYEPMVYSTTSLRVTAEVVFVTWRVAVVVVLFALVLASLWRCRQFFSGVRSIDTTANSKGGLTLRSKPLNFIRSQAPAPFTRLGNESEPNSHHSEETDESHRDRQNDLFEMTTFHRRGYLTPTSR